MFPPSGSLQEVDMMGVVPLIAPEFRASTSIIMVPPDKTAQLPVNAGPNDPP
jgi:hypothetical protein